MKYHSGVRPFFLEMIFVLLFLAVSCAAVLRLFSAAHAAARRSAELNAAMVLAQSAAETVQSAESPADLDRLFRDDRNIRKDGAVLYTAGFDENGNPAAGDAALRVEKSVRASAAASGTMLEAEITVFSARDGTVLFTLNAEKYCPG